MGCYQAISSKNKKTSAFWGRHKQNKKNRKPEITLKHFLFWQPTFFL